MDNFIIDAMNDLAQDFVLQEAEYAEYNRKNIDLEDKETFEGFLAHSDSYAMTLDPNPSKHHYRMSHHFKYYCDRRNIMYYFAEERAPLTNRYHYHGVIQFNSLKQRKNFQKWYNKFYGKIYISDKKQTGWWEYCHKDYPMEFFYENHDDPEEPENLNPVHPVFNPDPNQE